MKNYEELSKKGAELLIEELLRLERPVIGLATGSTPEGLYNEIIKFHKKTNHSFENVISFNLDEYIGLDADNPNSYHYFMGQKLFNHVDIDSSKTHLPNGVAKDLNQECKDFEAIIKEAGGIDLQLLGLGTNGHIGFNEPGSKFDGRTAIVDLAQETLDANAQYFDSIEDMPTQAITMGIGSIMEGEEILLLVSGESKAEALANVINGKVTEDFPASILQKHANVTIIADEAALAQVK